MISLGHDHGIDWPGARCWLRERSERLAIVYRRLLLGSGSQMRTALSAEAADWGSCASPVTNSPSSPWSNGIATKWVTCADIGRLVEAKRLTRREVGIEDREPRLLHHRRADVRIVRVEGASAGYDRALPIRAHRRRRID